MLETSASYPHPPRTQFAGKQSFNEGKRETGPWGQPSRLIASSGSSSHFDSADWRWVNDWRRDRSSRQYSIHVLPPRFPHVLPPAWFGEILVEFFAQLRPKVLLNVVVATNLEFNALNEFNAFNEFNEFNEFNAFNESNAFNEFNAFNEN